MLRLYPSNKTEHLALVIAEIMKAKPVSDPFSNELILIQSHGMGTWLQQEISQHLGISAMIECSMPASFIWQLSQILMPDDPHIPLFEKNNVRWQIFSCLPKKLSDPRYEVLAEYVRATSGSSSHLPAQPDSAQPSEQVIFELSDVLADLFDAYQNYRPDWISSWEKGESLKNDAAFADSSSAVLKLESWQADLWRSLYPDIELASRNHRAVLLSRLIERLKHCPRELQQRLPERIFIFGLSALPPQWLPVLATLSRYSDVHFLIQNPCQYYWGDVVSQTQQLKLEQSLIAKGVSAETAADTFLESNPLLASWGRLGRDYLSMLFHHDEIKEMPVDLYEDPLSELDKHTHNNQALAFLQADILNLQTEYRQVLETDHSIRFVSCHSHLREVEALHDYLFKLLDESSELKPKDVIVMMPDVQNFAALIDAIFSRPAYDQYGNPQYLPYGISDQMLSLDQPMVDVLSGILNLSKLRITATEVLDWLDIEAIRLRFGILEDDLEQIHAWVSGLSIRWGLSETHRDKILSSTQLSNESEQAGPVVGSGSGNTWLSAFKRLLAGYIYGVGGIIHDTAGDVLAQAQYSRDTQLLAGKLMRFLDVIEQTIAQQSGKQDVNEWLSRVSFFWQSWFDTQCLSDDVLQLMDHSVTSIAEQIHYAGFDQNIAFTIISEVICAGFEKERVSQRFLAGRINFCTLMPMRSIPFKVVCMLGMNEGQYPRPEHKVSFDLMSVSDARVGDRSRREDDRYLFLEALCSARSNLYISYCGHDIKDNSERYPSLLVSELQEYCARYFYLDDVPDEKSPGRLLNHWTARHRLQPFHPQYYSGNTQEEASTTALLPKSYSIDWMPLHHPLNDSAEHDADKMPLNKLPTDCSDLRGTQSKLSQIDLFQSSATEVETIKLTNLSKMANHPLRYHYQQILGVSYTEMEAEFEDSEPFNLSSLDAYQLKSDIARSWHESSKRDVLADWSLSDRLPRQPVDAMCFDAAQTSLSLMKSQIERFTGVSEITIDLEFQTGVLSQNVTGDLLIAGVHSSLKGVLELTVSKNIDSRFFGFWVQHVFWNVYLGRLGADKNILTEDLQQTAEYSGESTLVTPDKIWKLPVLNLETAERYASQVLAMADSLKRQPFPFLAKSTFAALFESESKMKSAFKGNNTQGASSMQGESADPYWKRFCLLSRQDKGRGIISQDHDVLPILNESIFYSQVAEYVEHINAEELAGKVHDENT